MKKSIKFLIPLFSLLVAMLFCSTTFAQTATFTSYNEVLVDKGIQWESMEYDYGKIPQGVPATATFKLTNTGNDPLIITNVKGACGCTTAKATNDPILPGETTTITATYNAKKTGHFKKVVKVSTNRSDTPLLLNIKGEVK